MADRPELIELIRHVVLHPQVVAGDVPAAAAAVRRAQRDAEARDLRLHLLGDDGRGLVQRSSLQRDVVDKDIRIEHAVAAVERLLDVQQTRAAHHAGCHQGKHQRRADHDGCGLAQLRSAPGGGLFARLARRGRFCLRGSAVSGRPGAFHRAGRRLPAGLRFFRRALRVPAPPFTRGLPAHVQDSARLPACRTARRILFFLRPGGRRAAALRCAGHAAGGNHPVRRILVRRHDAVRRLGGYLLIRDWRDRLRSSSSVRLFAFWHSLHLLLGKSGRSVPILHIINQSISYFISASHARFFCRKRAHRPSSVSACMTGRAGHFFHLCRQRKFFHTGLDKASAFEYNKSVAYEMQRIAYAVVLELADRHV